MTERFDRIVIIDVPDENKKEVLLGIENGDPISQLILKKDLALIIDRLRETGILDAWDVPMVVFRGNSEIDSDTPDRPGRVFAAVDNLDGTVKAAGEFTEFEVDVSSDIQDSMN